MTMRGFLNILLLGLILLTGARAHAAGPAMRALDDKELSSVSGGDGVTFAMHLELNQAPGLDSRLTIGQRVDGRMTYTVIRNPAGVVDMIGLGLSAQTSPEGQDYVAITLPGYVKFTNVGFDSLSVQQDPNGPVTESMGRFTLNGSLQVQGQLRTWAH